MADQELPSGPIVLGSWPADCVQRAFVDGAAWWQFKANGATAWSSERHEMEAEAIRRYGEPATTLCACGKHPLPQGHIVRGPNFEEHTAERCMVPEGEAVTP
jgi:hypothetical protein